MGPHVWGQPFAPPPIQFLGELHQFLGLEEAFEVPHLPDAGEDEDDGLGDGPPEHALVGALTRHPEALLSVLRDKGGRWEMGESLEMGDEMGDPKDGGGKGQRALGAWGGEWEKPLGTRVVIGKGEGKGESKGSGGGGSPVGGGGGGEGFWSGGQWERPPGAGESNGREPCEQWEQWEKAWGLRWQWGRPQ